MNQRFVTALRTAYRLSPPCARKILSTASHHIISQSTLIRYSRLCLGLPSGLFPVVFSTKTNHQATHHVVFSTPCFFLQLRPKYPPQHPIFEHPEPLTPPPLNVTDQVSHPYKRQYYSYAHFNLYILS